MPIEEDSGSETDIFLNNYSSDVYALVLTMRPTKLMVIAEELCYQVVGVTGRGYRSSESQK